MKKGKMVLQALFCLLLLSSISNFILANDLAKDVLPPDIMPVVILSGSDYEMGFQYGQLAGHLIEKAKDAEWASLLQGSSREKLDHDIKAIQYYIKKFTPEFIDQMKGIADGATAAGYSVSYADVLLLNCRLPKPGIATFPADAEKEKVSEKGCSVCSAWGSSTKDGRLIGMDTHDIGDALYQLVIVAFPEKGNNYMCGAQAGEIGDHFLMNNKGLFVGNSGGGGSPRDKDFNYGLSWSCSLPYLARFANSAVEARDMLLPWQINLPENFHFADLKGNAFVVEKTSAVQSVRKSGDFGEKDFLYSTNNYLNKKMQPTKEGDFIKEHGGYGAYAAPRNMMLWDLLQNYRGQVDVDFIKMILRFPGNPPPYPPEGGWDAKVCRPSNSRVVVIVPDEGDKGVAHICTGPAGRVIHSSIAGGRIMRSSYPYIHGTHTFYQLTLAASPKAVVAEAKKAAKEYIATAYTELMPLNFTDTGYTALSALYSLANEEYYQGCNAFNQGLLADGDEAISHYAKAATAFTRSQAHSMQVYEALVPAPTSPTDLGLKPFGGEWGKWETKFGKIKK